MYEIMHGTNTLQFPWLFRLAKVSRPKTYCTIEGKLFHKLTIRLLKKLLVTIRDARFSARLNVYTRNARSQKMNRTEL